MKVDEALEQRLPAAIALAEAEDQRGSSAITDLAEEERYRATPSRVAFVLGWAVASTIVSARYADSAIDALPIYHPDHGWDRFLLTRRVTLSQFADEPADSFGLIVLSGEDAPRITLPNGVTRLALGQALRDNPAKALAQAVALFPATGLPEGELDYDWETRQQHYPRLYRAVAELVMEQPDLVAAREILVDIEPVEGSYHPLYLHTVIQQTQLVYDWFLVQNRAWGAFFRRNGSQSIYETNTGGWATVIKQLNEEETVEAIKGRLAGWLRITGEPNPQTVD